MNTFVRLFLVLGACLLMFSCQITYKRPPFSVTGPHPIIPKKIEPTEKVVLQGYWVSKQSGQVIELLANGNVILNRFSSASTEVIEPQEFKIKSLGEKLMLSYSQEYLEFQRPANIQPQQLPGKWFVYINENGYESSRIITYDRRGYNYEIVELFHDDQRYSQYSQYYPYHFSKGFVFEDYFDVTESYWYFLLDVSDDKMSYVDETGLSWIQEKYITQPHVIIPKYYLDESF